MPLITYCCSIAQFADATGPRQVEMAALLNWEVMRPHAKPDNPIWHFPLVTPNKLGKLHFGGAQTSGSGIEHELCVPSYRLHAGRSFNLS